MRKRLLADHDLEAGIRERHGERAAVPQVHEMLQPHQLRQSNGAAMAALRDVEARDATAQAAREIARRAAHARAHIQDMARLIDAGPGGQDVDRLEAAEVVLVIVLQRVLGQPLQRDAVAGEVVQDLLLVDRMAVVEANRQILLICHAPFYSGGGTMPVCAAISP